MAWQYDQILNAHAERLLTERSEAMSMLESGRLREDADLVNVASDAILRIDRDRQQLGVYARQMVNDQQRAQAQQASNRFGLSRQEQEVAEASIMDRSDVRLTRDQKHQMYANNKAKYHTMLRNGSYSNDQGKVFR